MRSSIILLDMIASATAALADERVLAGVRPENGPPLFCVGLALALFIAGLAIAQMRRRGRALEAAQKKLHLLAVQIERGEMPDWEDTATPEIDEIAQSLLSFERRLREKRKKLREVNEMMLKGAAQDAPAPLRNSILRAMIDAMPVGVLVAEAPSGRILEGNRMIEAILRHPVIYSDSNADYRAWSAYHADGKPVTNDEYPLARALAGEDHPALECRYKAGDGALVWISIIGAPIRNERGEIIGAIVAVTDINEIKNAEAQRRAMNLELHHRVNNSLAMIQGIANITARTATNLASFRENFSDRIQCLSRISTLLVQKSWDRTPLEDVIKTAVDFEHIGNRSIQIEGEPVALRSEVALAVGMALHELLSNAEQFGALSKPGGLVRIDWRLDETAAPRLLLRWSESGGPPVTSPTRTGVGLYLLNSVLSRQLGGEVLLAFEPSGLHAEIHASI